MSFYHGPTIVTNGLVLSLDAADRNSYPGSGTTWFDTSGNGNNFTLINAPTYSSINGGQFTFNGTNQYASASGFANFTNGISIFAVVNFGNANSWERIIDFGNSAESNNVLFAREDITNNLVFEIYNGSTSRGQIKSTNGILNNTIAMYAATLDGTNCSLYRNGVIITGPTSYPYTLTNINRSICYIARSNWSNDRLFESSMNIILIYNRGLSSDEILQNYNATKSRFGLT